MAKQMSRRDLSEILDGLVAGDLIEGISDNRDMEEQLLIGAALKQIGEEITKVAREQALTRYRGTRGKHVEGRFIIEYRPASQQTRVDSAAVRTDLPPDRYPMYWKRINTSESIRVTMREGTTYDEALTLTRRNPEQGKAPAAGISQSRERGEDPASDGMSLDFDQGLFEELRELRRRLAGEKGIPPYMIFRDVALQQMAYYFPQSLESFSRISGVGEVNLKQFGDTFMAAIGSYAHQHGLVERSIPTVRSRERGEDPASDGTSLDFDQGLFEELRELRRRLAGERGVPPYMIFSDVALQQMAYYFPQSHASFFRISGVGEVKLEQFGDTFMAVIGSYAHQHGLVERHIPVTRRSRKQKTERKGSTYETTRQMLEQGLSVEQVAQARGLTEGAISKHLELIVESDPDIDIRSLLAPDRFEEIRRAFEETGGTLFSPVKELLSDAYSYDEIRMVWIALRREGELPD